MAWLVCQSYSLPNLIKYCNANINTKINTKPATVVEPGVLIYFLILPTYDRTWKCRFSDAEINNLNKYMVAGGFLHIDDNYGMDHTSEKK
jgi:hypothetical protein